MSQVQNKQLELFNHSKPLELIFKQTRFTFIDFFATVSINYDNPEEYKKKFIQKIYKPQKFKPIMAQHCCKLQDFPDWFEFHHKNSIAKKQFGNSVPIPVVYHIAKELINFLTIP